MTPKPRTWRHFTPSSPGKVALILAFALLFVTPTACLRDPINDFDAHGPTVDPEIYARGFCSLKCYRLEQCNLAVEPKETCEASCIDDAVLTVSDDPCWAQQIEVRRCWVRRAECDGVADEELPVGSNVCEHREQELDACDP